MNDFTASNGITVFVREGGTVQFQHGTRVESCGILQIMPGSEWWEALREFFQVEADERLGRWRWPENPDYVVYPVGDDVVDVLRESSVSDSTRGPGRQASITRADAAAWDSEVSQNFYRAARAYFDAHPGPKPWHDAVEGEVWALTLGDDTEPRGWMAEGDGTRFWRGGHSIDRLSGSISAGRRIWPEVSA
ncbi:hypothetical protein B0I12_002251 [Microbacterium hydrothermale]|uniref:hypothetical protein n=1 Tax=Microbacterium hydrothermale TaxID=857427 RepID=UPI002225DC26|nr:hypothetical protein [Microbacterium hydrothermale]MCW2165096.1 hypothetical protein [Microbacterium hydrothermale]